MKNITGSQIQYSVRMEKNEVCVCSNVTCTKHTSSQLQFQSNTIYRVYGTKDVYLKYDKSRHRAYPYSILGTKYVVPVLYLISPISTHHFLGIGNPTNTSVDVHVEYPRRNPFSIRSCRNVSYELRLDAFESIDLENNCQVAGVHINSTNKIIVYSASLIESYVMIDQLLPVELWGSFYIVSSPTDDILLDNIILVLTAYNNTAVHILGFDYVIIPTKYGSIQRRITGTDPITIKSSLPVSVTQYIKNKNNWVMINVIPMKYEINKDDIFDMVNIMYAFGTMENDALRSSENKLPIFSKFHYYTSISPKNLSQTLHGCVTSKTISSGQIVATNCGFTDPSHVSKLFSLFVLFTFSIFETIKMYK